MSLTGGCQCGAVRFSAEAVGKASICHCRMCQKAFGSAFGPLVTVVDADLTWTRGHPKYFQSSNLVRRGFCDTCGTPMTYIASEGQTELALGAFDDPNAVPPVSQLSVETQVAWFDTLSSLPVRSFSGADHLEGLVSFQHPDHEMTDQDDDGRGDGG